MQWSEDYVSDLDYPPGFYQEQGPEFLNIACVLNDIEPVRTDRPYTYLELGFGLGNTLAIHAASNPNGAFYGIDFMPSHVSVASRVAEAAQLENLHYLEHSFADLVDGSAPALPQCDFITLHGVYTWINRENQQYIITILKRYLKPGGIVYIGYNSTPGWNAELPLIRLLKEVAHSEHGDSISHLRSVTRLLEKLDIEEGGVFSETPALKNFLDTLRNKNPAYLAHEYLHHNTGPLYHNDVVRDLASAKLDYIGTTDLCSLLNLYFNHEKQTALDAIADESVRETVKDFFLNRKFRRDIFVRGGRKMEQSRQTEWLKTLSVALIKPAQQIELSKIQAGFMEVCLDGAEAEYRPMLTKLAEGPCTLAQLFGPDVLKTRPLPTGFGIVIMLTMSSMTTLFVNRPSDPGPTHRLNRVLAEEGRHNDLYRTMASPLTGGGVVMNPVDLLVYGILQQRPQETVSAIITQVQDILAQRGRRLLRNGEAIESDEENLAEIATYSHIAMEQKLPIWRQLGML
jgi:SAM-dependent methyltransferase